MFNKKLLILSLAAGLVGCGGDDSGSNRSYKATLEKTNLFTGSGIAMSKNEGAIDSSLKSEYLIINESGVAVRPNGKMTLHSPKDGKQITDAKCPTSNDITIYKYKDLGGELAIIHVGTNETIENKDSDGSVSCTSYEATNDYIVRKTDGKAWLIPSEHNNHYRSNIDYNTDIIKARSPRNGTTSPLINTFECSYGQHSNCKNKLAAVIAPQNNSQTLKFKTLYINKHIQDVTYNGKYLATRIYDGQLEEDIIFNVDTGAIPEYSHGNKFPNHSLPLVDSITNEIVSIENITVSVNNRYSFHVLDDELTTLNYDSESGEGIALSYDAFSIHSYNGVRYIVSGDSSIVTDETGMLTNKYSEKGGNKPLISKVINNGEQLVVINKTKAIVLDYLTSTVSTHDLAKDRVLIDSEKANLSDTGLLNYKVRGSGLFEIVHITLDVTTGTVIDSRTIKTEDGRDVIEVLPVN
ncbi:hypothetical protein [Photobacterium kagoshimensis]|uniref:hypothetical protein n=1 Tax=Photobacterium kagoshimensis TaxID=2910242 RepID=UPI003D0E913F